MKILVLATIAFAAVIGSAMAQNFPNAAAPNVPIPGPPPTRVKVFTVTPGNSDQEFTCDQGLIIQSLSAVHGTEDRNVSVVFLDQNKTPISNNPTSAYGFKLEQAHKPQDDVRVTMFCGG